MQTIAFYSYKGGVGRSLLVANAARFLGMLGKRVVALDLDVEAPGLHYKLGRAADPDSKPSIAGGAVPYLVATAKGAKNPPPLQEHMAKLALPEGTEGWLQLMPAGPAPRREYWTALKQLRERLRFDEPSGKGLAALLDLHARIEDELKPDYLLIDSRTGVTELGGLATTALADCVVCLLVPNQESVDGTLAIVAALKTSSQQTRRDPIRIVPVIARTTGDLASEGRMSEGIKRLVEIGGGRTTDDKKNPKPFVLPHDSALGAADKIVGGDKKASAFSPLHKAYLELFQNLFPQSRKEAEEVLHRLTAVAQLRERLTEGRGKRSRFRNEISNAFDPWEDSAIEEGVVFKSDRGKTTRYADLVCRDAKGDPLMIAECIAEGEESEALAFWKEQGDTRCIILLHKSKNGYAQKIYCRTGRWKEFEPMMGLRYDPLRNALKESDSLAAQLDENGEGDHDEGRTLHVIHQRLFRESRSRLCDDPPPALLWDQKLRKDRYWSGDLDDLDGETHEKTKKFMSEATQLRTWLRGKINRNTLVTGSLLGRYDPASGRVELYPAILDALGPLLGLQPRYLRNIVFIQLSVWAIAHQAHDCDGQPGFGFAVASAASPFQRESPAHIAISQYFVFRLIERLADISLMGAL